MQGSAAAGINDPVEDDRKEEEGHEMEDFVVYIAAELQSGQTGVASQQQQKQENTLKRMSASPSPAHMHAAQIPATKQENIAVAMLCGQANDVHTCKG